MQIYLPIAEIPARLETLVAVGGGVGFLSGLFGVGGGFLLTPLLFFIGVPPAVAVATGVNQVAGSSFSAFLTQLKRGAVDLRMGMVLLVGGAFGSIAGVWGFNQLRALGQFDLVVSLTYVVLLSLVGGLMLFETVSAAWPRRRARPPIPRSTPRAAPVIGPPAPLGEDRHKHRSFAQRLPLKMKFPKSRLCISVIPPVFIGFVIGFLGALLGVGGGFILIPAMIYILGMPANVVVGTSLFQVLIVSCQATLMHAVASQTVDALLAVCLLLGGVIGAQIGAILGGRLRAHQLRALLALVVLAVAMKLAYDLIAVPAELFVIEESGV